MLAQIPKVIPSLFTILDFSYNNLWFQDLIEFLILDHSLNNLFSFKELEFLYKNAHLSRHQEHVTNFFWENFNKKNIRPAKTNIPKSKRYLRVLIDTKKDFNIINNFVKKFSINVDTNTKDIVNYLHKYKAVKNLLIKKN